jgi:uncharacterized membrane protein
MLLYLIKVLDNTFIFFLASALVLPILKKEGRRKKSLLTVVIIVFGVLSAIVYAILRRQTGFVVREFYDLALLFPLVLLVLFSALVYGIRIFREVKYSSALKIVDALFLAFLLAFCLPDLFLEPLDFGVGLDSVFNLDYLLKVSGYVSGLLILFFLFITLYEFSSVAPSKLLKLVILISLFLLSFFLVMEVVQILVARRKLSLPDFLVVPFFLFLENKNFFISAQLILWAFFALFVGLKFKLKKPMGDNPALKRKSKAENRYAVRLALFGVVTFSLIFIVNYPLRQIQNRGVVLSDPDPINAQNGVISINLSEVNDGNLHRHVYTTEKGTPVRFIVIKKSESAYGIGLDACDICGESGYYQKGDKIICRLCDVVMNKSTIGFPGGCNPVPIEFEIKSGQILIKSTVLDEEQHRFH